MGRGVGSGFSNIPVLWTETAHVLSFLEMESRAMSAPLRHGHPNSGQLGALGLT